MMQHARLLGLLILVGALVACEPGPVAIPAGAQQVQVTATTTGITLQPATVSAGDVYLVLNLSPGATELTFGRTSAGGMSDAQIAQLVQTGDAGQGAEYEDLSASCCGNVTKKTLTAGNYPILVPSLASPGSVVAPLASAILHVTP